MTKREIDRNPPVPHLSQQSIELLTKLCFRTDDPLEKVDLIFVFSTPLEVNRVATMIDELLAENISNKVFVTGGVPTFDDYKKLNKSESELLMDLIDQAKYPDVQFYQENQSHNTLENVKEALQVLDFRSYKKILFIFKTHASRRGYLTLKNFLPQTKILQKTFGTQYEGTDRPLTITTWHTYDFGKSRVWGEYLRIEAYSSRGDIALDEETASLLQQIKESVK